MRAKSKFSGLVLMSRVGFFVMGMTLLTTGHAQIVTNWGSYYGAFAQYQYWFGSFENGPRSVVSACSTNHFTATHEDIASRESLAAQDIKACQATINAVVQAWAANCKGQVTVNLDSSSPSWQPTFENVTPPEFIESAEFGASASCEDRTNGLTSIRVPGGAQAAVWPCADPFGQLLYPILALPVAGCSGIPSPPLAVELIDPIADNLASGAGLVSNSAQLAAASHVVQGVAADNATQVLVRVESSGSTITAGDQIQLTLSDENGPSSDGAGAGYLTSLPANGPDSRLTGGVITVTAVDNGSGAAMAFAVYHAPTDFVRTGNVSDPTVKIRAVTIGTSDTRTGTTAPTQTISIVRPPVVLVHGIWGSPNDFNGADGGLFGLQDSGLFTLEYARYDGSIGIAASDPTYVSGGTLSHPVSARVSALGFKSGATTILPQIQNVIKEYKVVALLLAGQGATPGPIAAVQADIVAHSMGGDVTRTLPQLSEYAVQSTYNLGYVHKLITVDTPHRGTPLASALLSSSNACVRTLLTFDNRYAFNSVTSSSGAFINGATGDLATGSQALNGIHSGSIMIPTAMIGGQMTDAQQNGAGKNAAGQAVFDFCGLALSNPLALSLSALAWPTVVGDPSDAIVPLSSQVDGELSYSSFTNTFIAVHSAGAEALGFGGPAILDRASQAPAEVINLLNTPVSNSAVFEEKP